MNWSALIFKFRSGNGSVLLFVIIIHTYQPSRESLDIQGFDLSFRDPEFIKNSEKILHIVDIHNIYEINLIPK